MQTPGHVRERSKWCRREGRRGTRTREASARRSGKDGCEMDMEERFFGGLAKPQVKQRKANALYGIISTSGIISTES